MKKLYLILLICMTTLTSQNLAEANSKGNKKLIAIHAKIVQKYPRIKHIDAADFVKLKPNMTLIFDVRKSDEYKVSHINNAIQINPDIKTSKFIERYSQDLSDKTLIFYCSVGERSSKLVSKLTDTLQAQNIKASFNLTGGIFQWHNEKRELMQEESETKLIHPYNRFWGRLIDDKNAISYEHNNNAVKSKLELE